MKKTYIFPALLLVILLLHSCLRDECTSTSRYVQLVPVNVSAAQFRTGDIKTSQTDKLENPGKIYSYKNYLLINEAGKGIHFYDIADPANPKHIIFYEILGNFDMAIQGDVLIADNVIDLISIDIHDVLQPKLINRHNNFKNGPEFEFQQFTAYYERSNIVSELDCSQVGPGTVFVNWNNNFWQGEDAAFVNSVFSSAQVTSSSGSGSGVGGSTAKFTIAKGLLYTLNDNQLLTWNIDNLLELSKNDIGWGIETIFAYNDYLFVGANNGMSIFSLENAKSPKKLSTLSHATACDPVVVQGNTAYVTLRSGTRCSGADNQLDVINISNPSQPVLTKTYAMKSPRGLSIFNDKLYVCEGDYGFKILNAKDNNDIKEIVFDKSISAQDVIALDEQYAMVIGSEGFFRVDVSKPNDLKIVGKILVDK